MGAGAAAPVAEDVVPARHAAMKSFFFCPDAWIAAFFVVYSASHSLTVFAVDGSAVTSIRRAKALADAMQAVDVRMIVIPFLVRRGSA
jgi:hypothetical protein